MVIFIFLLVLAGLGGGLISGLLGIGGGVLFILVLPEALAELGVPPADIPATQVANALLATLVSASAACYQHRKLATAGLEDILWVGLPAAAVAYTTLSYIVMHPSFSDKAFGYVLIAILAASLARALYLLLANKSHNEADHLADDAKPLKRKLLTTGALAGLVSSLTGLGGGILVIPVLREWAKYPMRRASFVSSGMIVVSSIAVLIFSLEHQPKVPIEGAIGMIVPGVALPLGIGVVVAAPWGVKWARHLSARTLTVLYAALVALVLARRLWLLF